MKSETRAWIIFVLLLIFWRTLPVSPFNYFAGMIRDWFDLVAGQPFLPPVWQVLISFLMISLLLTALLLVGRTRSRLYLAGICGLVDPRQCSAAAVSSAWSGQRICSRLVPVYR